MSNSTPRIVSGDCALIYIIGAEAWYAYTLTNLERADLLLFAQAPGGGVSWEVRLIDRADLGHPHVELRVFNDGMAAFAEVPDFFAALAAEQPRDLVAVRTIAERIGAVDGTPRQRPSRRPLDEGSARAVGEVL